MNQKKLGVVFSYAQVMVNVSVNLLYTPVMLRMLGQSEYGVYSLSNSVIGFLGLLYAGMASTYLRYYSLYRKNDDQLSVAKLNGLFVVLFSALGSCALLLGLIFADNLKIVLGSGLTIAEYDLARVLFVIMSVNMALLMLKTVFSTLILSYEQFVFIKVLDVLQSIMVPLVTLPLLYLGYGSIGMSCVMLLLTGASLLASMWYCIRNLSCQFSFVQIPFSMIPEMLSFSIFILLQGVMDQFNWQLGKVLLSNFADSSAIAVYTVGLQIDMLIISFSAAFSGVFVPQIYQLVQRQAAQELNQLWLKVGRYQFFVVYFLWTDLLFFGNPFIQLWAGPGYESAYIVAILLLLPMMIHLCQSLAMEILRAYNRHGMWTLVHFIASFLGLLLCIPLTKAYGVMGVATGTCVSMFVVVNIYDNWYYSKAAKLDVWAFFIGLKKLLPAAIAIACCAGGLAVFIEITSWKIFIFVEMFFSLIYMLIMYHMGMNAEERQQIKVIMYKINHQFSKIKK